MPRSGCSPAARRTPPVQSESAFRNRADRAFAPSALRTAPMIFTPRRWAAMRHGRPSGGHEDRYFAPGIRHRPLCCAKQQEAITVFGSNRAAMASGRSSGMGVTNSAFCLEEPHPSAQAGIEDHPHARLQTLCRVYPCAHAFDDGYAIASPVRLSPCLRTQKQPSLQTALQTRTAKPSKGERNV
jgi:hypothetical protein